jgi:hypothetical protein
VTAPMQLTVPNGMIAFTSYGSLTMETVMAWGEMREALTKQGLNAVWICVPGSLVDRARNNAVTTFLQHQPQLGWLCFIDGDAVFEADALTKLLIAAYKDIPHADAIGGLCTLRGDPFLPTIDTGTGTWESWLPGHGPIEVMRTGSAFILMKRHCFEKVPGPWYGTRNPMRPIDALAEIDNFAHTKFDGRNPLSEYPEWQALLKCALDDPSTRQRHNPSAFVGEDSNWCDQMRFAGLRIYVHTDVEVKHVDRAIRDSSDHRKAMELRENMGTTMVGCLK